MKKTDYIKRSDQKGFTIIEVVLVLAIAGLIFVVVFLAVPQLQASRRDTQRRSDAGRVLAALEDFAANNNAAYPTNTNLADFRNRYLNYDEAGNEDIKDPTTGVAYNITWSGAVPTNVGDMRYLRGRNCNGEAFSANTGNIRDIAVMVLLDNEEVRYCVDNQ